MPVDDHRVTRALPTAFAGLPRLPVPMLPNPAKLAQYAFNALLKRESWAREKLTRHSGKTVRLAVGDYSAGMTFTSEGYAQVADTAVVPDVTVTLSLEKMSLSRLLAMRDSADGQAIMDITHISGDAGLAQIVGELARHLRWDVEDELAQKIGDVPATRLIQAAKGVSDGVRTGSQRLVANVAEYLSEERKVLVGKPLFDDHSERLADTIRTLDALEARLNRFASRTDRT